MKSLEKAFEEALKKEPRNERNSSLVEVTPGLALTQSAEVMIEVNSDAKEILTELGLWEEEEQMEIVQDNQPEENLNP